MSLRLFMARVCVWCLFLSSVLCANTDLPWVEIRFHSDPYLVQVAQSPEERQHGLMGRRYLMAHQGMLFVFPEQDKHTFWMKNTSLPLDLLWLDDHKQVVDIVENATPNSLEILAPKGSAKYVIELLSGQVQQKQMKIGDQWSWGELAHA